MTIAGVFETRIHVGKRRFAKHASIAKPLHDVTMRRFRPVRGAWIEILTSVSCKITRHLTFIRKSISLRSTFAMPAFILMTPAL